MPRPYSSHSRNRVRFRGSGSVHRRFKSPLGFFVELQRECGDAARFRLFNERFLLISDPVMVNEVLVSKQECFRKGKALEGARHFLGDSLLVSEGAEHTRQRRLIQPAFHRGRIAGYAKVMAEKAAHWRDARRAGEEIDVAVQMNHLTLEVVLGETLFGSHRWAARRTRLRSRSLPDRRRTLAACCCRSGAVLAPPGSDREAIVRLARAPGDSSTRPSSGLIAQRRAENRDRGDLLSMLLAAEDADNPAKRLTDREIRDQALTLFLAGHETTANALAWTWHLLAGLHEPGTRG